MELAFGGLVYRIGISCEKQIIGDLIAEAINKPDLCPLVFSCTSNLVASLNSGELQALVFGLRKFGSSQLKVLDSIKGRVPQMPVTILAKEFAPGAKELVTRHRNTAVLTYPDEIENVSGVCEKMFQSRPVSLRNFVRYQARVQGKIFRDKEPGQTTNCLMTNISQGGARCEVYDRSLEVGEEASLYLPLLNILKGHKVKGKVAWTRKCRPRSGYTRGYQEVGFAFVG